MLALPLPSYELPPSSKSVSKVPKPFITNYQFINLFATIACSFNILRGFQFQLFGFVILSILIFLSKFDNPFPNYQFVSQFRYFWDFQSEKLGFSSNLLDTSKNQYH